MEKKKQIRLEYEAGAKYKDLAEKYGISVNTIKSWRSREKWQRKKKKDASIQKVAPKKLHPNSEKVAKVAPIESADADGLNDKQKAFCDAYLISFNATQSYIKAYNTTYGVAVTNGPRLLRNARVQSYLQKVRDQHAKEVSISIDRLILQQLKIAFNDFGNYVTYSSIEKKVYDDDGNPVVDPETGQQKTYIKDEMHLKDQDKVDTSLIESLSVSPKDGIKLKLLDQSRALNWLMNYFTLGGKDKARLEVERIKSAIKTAKAKADALNGSSTVDQQFKVDSYLDMLKEVLLNEDAEENRSDSDSEAAESSPESND